MRHFREVVCVIGGGPFTPGDTYPLIRVVASNKLLIPYGEKWWEVYADEQGGYTAKNGIPRFEVSLENDNNGMKKLQECAEKYMEATRCLYKYGQITASLKEAKRLSEEIKKDLDGIKLDFSILS